LTGKHVTTAPDDEPWNGGTISDCLALLNALSTSIAPGPDEPQAPTPFFSPDGVCNLLRAKCNGDQQAWAKANGLSPAYVSDVLNGRRDPADKILAALGLRRLSLVTFADMLDPQSLAAPLPDEEAVERAPFAPPPLNDRCPCHGSLWWECPDRVTDEVEEQDRRRALASIPSTEGGLRSAGHALAEAVAALISATDGNEELRPQRQAGVDAMRAFEAALAAAPKPSGGPDE
jgi:hypothetical protein